MKTFVLWAFVVAIGLASWALAQNQVPATLSASNAVAAEPLPRVPLPPGMTPLFDGKTLDGWVQVPANSWTVNDGAIASLGVGRGVIYTKAQYGSYRVIFGTNLSGDEETAQHARELHRLAREIHDAYPSLEVEKLLMALDGSVETVE